MMAKAWKLGLGLLAGCIWSTGSGFAGSMDLTGSLVGFVSNSAGVAQMGATVLLYNRYDKLIGRTLTNEKGAFGFDSLPPDTYSLRVSLASFVPAVKDNIQVQPGMRSFLAINLTSVLSSIELVYSAPGQGSLLSDDWKWVLRSSNATRSVLRYRPNGIDLPNPNERTAKSESQVFSATRGVVKVSAGDQAGSSSFGQETDLGTAFALATSVFGANQLQFVGNLGYGMQSGAPATAFSTRYSRTDPSGISPEVQLTMRQVFLPARTGTALMLPGQDRPILRSVAVAVHDRNQVTDDLTLEYGFSLESVTYIEKLNFFSPFARATYSLGDLGTVQVGYNGGAPPLQLLRADSSLESDLQHDLAALALFPRVSLKDGRARVQRADNFEIGYKKVVGERTYSVGAYQETITDAALTMATPAGVFAASDLLPDISSNSSIFNIGTFRSRGLMASVTQAVGDRVTVSIAYGTGGALRIDSDGPPIGDAAQLRQQLRSVQRHWVNTRVSTLLPITGTRITTSYQWTDGSALTPVHTYITQSIIPQTGFNVNIRQPIPHTGLPGRLEATADLRNLLADGYLPVTTASGRTVRLIHSPRAVRGGLSFIF